jgi:hypothetical protein
MPGKGKTAYYFPSREADVIPWIRNFVVVLAANAARWGIAEALVTALGNLGIAYEEAYNPVPGQVRQVIAYCTDSGTPERRGKPYGAKSIELACAVLASPPRGIEDMVRFVTASKSPVTLAFREEDDFHGSCKFAILK